MIKYFLFLIPLALFGQNATLPRAETNLSSDPNCTKTGQRYYNTASSVERYCTATGTPGTWVAVSTASVTGGTCTNQAATAINTSGVPTCSSITEAYLSTADNTTANVTSTKHGLAPKSPADATKFMNGDTTPGYALVKDSDLSTSDVTTNNATTSKHGFIKKLDNNANHFMDGQGNWSTPSGGGGSGLGCAVSSTSATSTLATPCVWNVGNVTYELAGDATAVLSGSSTSGTVYWYIGYDGVLYASEGTVATLTCTNCTAAVLSDFPDFSQPIATAAFTSNVYDTDVDMRGSVRSQIIVPGTDMTHSTNVAGYVELNPNDNITRNADLQAGTPQYCAGTFSSNAIACNLTPALNGYTTGMIVWITSDTTTSTTTTLAINGLTAKTIKRVDGSTNITTDIISGHMYWLTYDGTNFRLMPGGLIGRGTATLGTSSISSGACASAVTTALTGVTTADVISFTPTADLSAVTGYEVTGGLRIYPYPSSGNVNFKVCNGSGSSITPGAATLNWSVIR